MNDILEIQAEKRENSNNTKLMRKNGKIPAIVYGEKKDPLLITVDNKLIRKQIETPGFFSKQFSINIEGEKYRVLPKDLQLHPVKETILHLDFLRIGENTKVTVSIPVKFVNENECPGLKQGGVINIVRHEVEIKAPANKIPEMLEVNLEGLEIGDSIHISAVKLDEDVKPLITDRDFTIATLAPPTVIQEVEEKQQETDESESSDDEKTDDKKDDSEEKKE